MSIKYISWILTYEVMKGANRLIKQYEKVFKSDNF